MDNWNCANREGISHSLEEKNYELQMRWLRTRPNFVMCIASMVKKCTASTGVQSYVYVYTGR